MADELEVKEITELNDVSFTDESLVLAYTENDGIGKATFANAKSAIGADISIEQTKTGTTPSAVNELTATVRNGGTTETKKFVIRNGTGLSQAAQTESTDANGLRSNSVSLKSSDTTLVNDVEFTIKDGVGIKAHSVKDSVDTNGLRKSTLDVSYTDGKTDSVEIKDGIGVKSHSTESSVDDNGLRKNSVNIAYTDGTSDKIEINDGIGVSEHSITKETDENGLSKSTLNLSYTDGKTESAEISDGVGIKTAEQTTSSTLSGELNEYTIKLTDGTESKIKVYNGRAGKDFRIKKTYSSIAAMQADFSGTDVGTYEFAMIDTGSVEDADTGKLYCKNETEWSYIGDLSGAQGIKGDTGNGIASITNQINNDGNIDIVITMTDGTQKKFIVQNGTNIKAGTNISISNDYKLSVDMQKIFAQVYPVGSLYWSSKSTNPSSLFGGTWKQITDRFVLAAGSTYKAEATGGAATVTLTKENMPSHSHSFTPSGTIMMDAHSHGLNGHAHTFTPSGTVKVELNNSTHSGSISSTSTHQLFVHGGSSDISSSGCLSVGDFSGRRRSGGTDSNNGCKTLSFSLTTNVSVKSSSFSGSSGTTSSSNGTTTTTTTTGAFKGSQGTTDAKGSGTAFSIMPPYVVKYCWERTA